MHEQYLAIGNNAQARQSGYRGLFEIKADTDELAIFRASLSSGTPLGNAFFKKQVEIMSGRKIGLNQPGRPRQDRSSD